MEEVNAMKSYRDEALIIQNNLILLNKDNIKVRALPLLQNLRKQQELCCVLMSLNIYLLQSAVYQTEED